jgi:hypothetical protein
MRPLAVSDALGSLISQIDFDSEHYYNLYFGPAEELPQAGLSDEIWSNLSTLTADLNKMRGELSRMRRSVEELRMPAIEMVGLDKLAEQLRGLETKMRPLSDVLSRPADEGQAKRLLKDVLMVIDALDRVFDLADQQPQSISEGMLRGLKSVYDLLMQTLAKHGLQPVEVGRQFDPHQQIAMGTEPNPELPDGSVSRVLARGFLLNGQILRTAQVVVVKNAPAQV